MTPPRAMTVLTDEQLEREYRTWSDVEIREHFEAAQREAVVQPRLGDRQTALSSQRCRQTADRFSRELLRRTKERSAT